MAIVKMHRASDGSLHENYKDFADHEAKIKINDRINSGEVSFDMSAFLSGHDFGDPESRFLDSDDIGRFVAENYATLRSLLNDAAVMKRKSKVGAAK